MIMKTRQIAAASILAQEAANAIRQVRLPRGSVPEEISRAYDDTVDALQRFVLLLDLHERTSGLNIEPVLDAIRGMEIQLIGQRAMYEARIRELEAARQAGLKRSDAVVRILETNGIDPVHATVREIQDAMYAASMGCL
jgi:hypothetical protein